MRRVLAASVKLQSNHTFCVDWALAQEGCLRVLDYGCGGATMVSALRAEGIEAFGCDAYYGGGDLSHQVPRKLLDDGSVRRMVANTIPFGDESFDLVINNTVLEHVESLDSTLAEITRVLKPGGKVLSLFPHREVWLEWHVGLPFIHRFATDSWWRLPYATLLRSIGLGFHKSNKPIGAWSRDAIDWIDRWTHYRSRVEIERTFERSFEGTSRLESRWLDHKFDHVLIIRCLPGRWKQFAVTLLAGLVFECRKPATNEAGPASALRRTTLPDKNMPPLTRHRGEATE